MPGLFRRAAAWGLVLGFAVTPALAQPVVRTVAGGGPADRQANGVMVWAYLSASMVVDARGDLFISNGQATIYRVRPDGWTSRFHSDPVPSSRYCGLAIDRAGDFLIADCVSDRILRLDDGGGGVTVVAGNGTAGFSGDGGPATMASLNLDDRSGDYPVGLTTDASNNIHLSDTRNHRVRRIDAVTGTITTVAGIGLCGVMSDGVPASSACLFEPRALAFDLAGNLFLVDSPANGLVRRIDAATSTLTIVAGGGTNFYPMGVPAREALLNTTCGIAIDGQGNLFLADPDYDTPAGGRFAPVLRLDAPTQTISMYAGNADWPYGGLCGDGGPAIDACLPYTGSIALDSRGGLYVVDTWHYAIRRIDLATGIIDTAVIRGCLPESGAPGPLIEQCLGSPEALVVEAGGTFLASVGNRVVRVDEAAGTIATIAGSETEGFSGDGGPATAALLSFPRGLAVDAGGHLFLSDYGNNRVRRVDGTTGVITTVAGDGIARYAGDTGPATAASLNCPHQLAFDATGGLLIADQANNRIRRVDPATGIITTIAGDGVARYAGDGGLATAASLNRPASILRLPGSDLLIADRSNHRIRRIDAAAGTIHPWAGTGTGSFGGDGGPATSAGLWLPTRLAIDGAGRVLIGDEGNLRIRRIDTATGEIATFAGNGTFGFNGDGRDPLDTWISPRGIAVDATGRALFGDSTSWRVRAVTLGAPPAGEVLLTASLTPGGGVLLSWDRSCVRTDYDYDLYEGTLGDFTSHAPRGCSTDGRTSLVLTPQAADAYYLVVPRNAYREGSYGQDGGGSERAPAAAACVPQAVTTTCP